MFIRHCTANLVKGLILKTLLCILCIYAIVPGAQAQNKQPNFIFVLKNQDLNNKIIRLDSLISGARFTLQWMGEGDYAYMQTFWARKGKHAYDVRANKNWKGKTAAVFVINDNFVSNPAVVTPTLADEWDMFINPEQYLASTINLLYGFTFKGYKWRHIMTFGFVILGLFLFLTKFKRKKLPLALLSSLIIWFVILDARTMIDHQYNFSHYEDNYPQKMHKRTIAFSDRIRSQLKDKSWGFKNAKWPYTKTLRYYLAEYRHISATESKNKNVKPDYIIEQVNPQKLNFYPNKK